MKINKNSFHYKVVSNITDIEYDLKEGRQFTLCKYFWMFVGSFLFYPFIKFKRWLQEKIDTEGYNDKIGTVGIILFIVFVYSIITWASINFILDKDQPTLGIITGLTLLFIFYILPLGILIYSKYEDSETVNLITSYIKSKKQKVCPILEFKKGKTKKKKINKKSLYCWTLIILGYIGLFLEIYKIIPTTTFSTIIIISLFVASIILIIISRMEDKK